MTDKQLINKNKKSKLSKLIDDVYNEIVKSGLSVGKLAKELEKPYNRLSSSKNLFLLVKNYDKALILLLLIDKIHDFSTDCVDPDIWTFPEKKEVDKKRKELLKKRDKIIKLLNSLMPIEATKKPAHQYIRYCRFNPNSFIVFVDIIVAQLKEIYKEINLEDRDAKREKAVEMFLDNQIEEFYRQFSYTYSRIGIKPAHNGLKWLKLLKVDYIYKRGDSFSKVALTIISYFAKCDYDALVEIRTNHNKAKKTYLKLIK